MPAPAALSPMKFRILSLSLLLLTATVPLARAQDAARPDAVQTFISILQIVLEQRNQRETQHYQRDVLRGQLRDAAKERELRKWQLKREYALRRR